MRIRTVRQSRVRSLGQNMSGPLVKAFALAFSHHYRCGMNFRRYSQQYLAGDRFIGLLSKFHASGEIIVNCLMKCGFKFFNRPPVKPHNVTYSDKMTDKYPVMGVILDTSGIFFVLHGVHSFTPIDSRKCLASVTRYRNEFFCG